MGLQDRRRNEIGDVARHNLVDRVGLDLIRHRGDDLAAAHDLIDGHGDGLLRHVIDGGEPALAKLLAAAGVVEVDDLVGGGGVEIGGRIVEGDVGILADADDADVDGLLTDELRQVGDG